MMGWRRKAEWKDGWQGGYSRRVVWYEQATPFGVRLDFEDESGTLSRWYTDPVEAMHDKILFKRGSLRVASMKEGRLVP